MQKKRLVILGLITLTLTLSSLVMANAGTGSIRIDPALPIENSSPADFTLWVQPNDDAYHPNILLVMTDSCYNGLVGDVVVSWDSHSVSFSKADFTMEDTNGDKIPGDTTNGAMYTVASLKDHLNTDESIWWAMAPILDGPMIVGTNYHITVTMASSNPEMLVYVLGKSSSDASLFDMNIPNTIPGFVIPEVPMGTLLALATMVAALGVTMLRKK